MEIPGPLGGTASAPTDTAASATRLTAADREKVKQFAHDFEALLMTGMLKEMRRSMLSDEDQELGFGSATMTDTIDSELGSALARSGGLGLAAVMMRALDRQQGLSTPTRDASTPSTTAVTPTGAASSASADVASSSSADVASPQGVVTSAFGWRSDPITGETRFHSGTDIRLAYGQDVRAAAGGRVVFAGEQSGYGETVVIDHGDGLETRYAHLSSAAVRVGDRVASGQVVARSGNSGRTTGPHLHFEVLKEGRAVDPAILASGVAPKDLAAVADSIASRSAQ